MVAVDLIPEELKTGWLQQKRFRRWAIIILCITVIAISWTSVKYLTLIRVNAAFCSTKEQYQNIARNVQVLQQMKSQLECWRKRIVVLDQLDRYCDYVQITDYLAQCSPELIYLEEMKFSHPDSAASSAITNPPSPENLPKSAKMFILKSDKAIAGSADIQVDNATILLLKGRALDHKAVADYLTKLKASNIFLGVKLILSRRESSAPDGIVDFAIEGSLMPVESLLGVDYADMQKTKNF